MGYYDEDGNYHSFRHGIHKLADKVESSEVPSNIDDSGCGSRPDASENTHQVNPDTATIPCHHVRIGDFLMINGRPCQVIRISTSSATGQYKFLGVDVFTRQLHEETSTVSNAAPGVSVQTMHGPVFKQYRVLSNDNGSITAIPDIGSPKQGLPILDQSNLYARLDQALKSGHGSVRVLVLRDKEKNKELAVDIKILPDSSIDEPTLHAIARNGHESILKEFLNRAATNINQLDKFNRTALFAAVEAHITSVVRLLLDADIDINAVDVQGKTALSIAASKPELYSMAALLLENGALATQGTSPSVVRLLSATVRGDIQEVGALLDGNSSASALGLERPSDDDDGFQRVKVTDSDKLGYTALHEAACFGHYDIANLLITKAQETKEAQDAKSQTSFLGETVLHAVIDRGGKHRKYLTDGREKTLSLGDKHVRVFALLLRNGASAKHRRRDGKRVQDLVSQQLLSRELTPIKQRILQRILVLLSDSSSVGTQTAEQRPQQEAGDAVNRVASCNRFKLRLQYFFATKDPEYGERPVENFLYGPTATALGGFELQKPERGAEAKKEVEEEQDVWKWAHLPVKNKGWVEDTVGALSGMSGTLLKMYTRAMKAFIRKSFHEIRGPAPHAILRRPLFTPFVESHGGIFALVLPFFDSESLEYLPVATCRNLGCRRSSQAHMVQACRISHQDDLNIHVPLTLDQSYYMSLQDATNRNEDQVVVKYAKRQEQGGERRTKNILMVNQLWIWKVDAKTVVTALADRVGSDGQKSPLIASLSEAMHHDPPPSLDLMIIQIIKAATNFVDAPANAGLGENLFDIFEQSIAHWAEKEAACFQDFHQRQQKTPNDTNRLLAARHARKQQQDCSEKRDLCDISLEVGYLREIMDIKDELKMMERVLVDQDTVLSRYEAEAEAEASHKETPSSTMGQDSISSLKQSLAFRIAKVQKLARDASTVENSLNHLLHIKQKQESLNVAQDTRRLADEAEKRALDGESQTKLLFIFTLVTVIFTPVSFVCAFLAVPTLEFPRNSSAGGIAWRWWQVLLGAFVIEVATLVGVIVYWAAQKNISAIDQKTPIKDEES
ncbi:hypothetical protein BB8028_0007g06830 [Beauveria bassiana]|uniref:Translation initiation factor 5A-like N-terminal domain-containing protein n=1 Tax=Beauveria bassiana TaxID=176275 RepID=A0A2S7YMX2_BEABA|nr:hypothetical protein BB8028_0007g06830 [Beauveria bassiana]